MCIECSKKAMEFLTGLKRPTMLSFVIVSLEQVLVHGLFPESSSLKQKTLIRFIG